MKGVRQRHSGISEAVQDQINIFKIYIVYATIHRVSEYANTLFHRIDPTVQRVASVFSSDQKIELYVAN